VCTIVSGEQRTNCVTRRVGNYICLNLMPTGLLLGEDDEPTAEHADDAAQREQQAHELEIAEEEERAFTERLVGGMLPRIEDSSDGKGSADVDLQLHVLFVDDDPFQANVMTMLCASNGYNLTHFANGPDAIEELKLTGHPYNLVLLDLNMQPMHGLEVLKAIRRFNKHITVIIITATEDDHMVKACILHGANSYLVKPVREKDVRNIGHFAIEATKAEKRRRRARVRSAIASVLMTKFAIVFMPLRAFKAEGRLIPHEEARAKGLLTQCDTYDEVAEFIRVHPTAFFSHQWLSRSHPDPDGRQYELMLDASRRLCELEGVSEESLFVWIDYSSIPQRNKHMQRMSISTLGVYASLCKYFVVVAPECIHADTRRRCDATTYRKRGWCRLEQWAHLTAAGTANMFAIERAGDLGMIDEQDAWVDDSIRVFGGDFTFEEDKRQLVDVVLGLWSLTLVAHAAGLTHVLPIIKKVDAQKAEVFPSEHFGEMVNMLEEEIRLYYEDAPIPGTQLEAGANVALSPQPSPSRRNRYSTMSTSIAPSARASEMHLVAAELVEDRRLYHSLAEQAHAADGAKHTALSQLRTSCQALKMTLEDDVLREVLLSMRIEPTGPPLAFSDYCRALGKLRRVRSSGVGMASPILRISRSPLASADLDHPGFSLGGSSDRLALPAQQGIGGGIAVAGAAGSRTKPSPILLPQAAVTASGLSPLSDASASHTASAPHLGRLPPAQPSSSSPLTPGTRPPLRT